MSTQQPRIEGFEKLRQIAAKAQDDDDYRQRLKSDPAAVLKQEGLTVPDGIRVVVHENTDDEVHLVLPTKQPEELDVNETHIKTLSAAIHF